MAGLADPFLKLDWAKRHLDALDSLLQSFIDGGEGTSYTCSRYDDLEHQEHVLEVRLADIPDPICLTAGDALYCMRSSLDQLVWSLASGPGGLGGPDRTQFPILDKNDSDGRKRFKKQTRGVPAKAIADIEAFQPYHRGASYKSHPLWRLNAMCNLDKHRRIPANGSELRIFFPDAVRTSVFQETTSDCHILRAPLVNKHELQFKFPPTFQVNFGEGDPMTDPSALLETVSGFREMHQFIDENVLPRFIKFFPG